MAHGQGRTNTTVAIIGAGFSGTCTAIDLIKRNQCRDFVILEKGLEVGGTWSDNTYPGCCCDVQSHLYSYSFEPNSNWSREFPTQAEIQRHMVSVAEKWGLYRHIRFNSTVSEGRWNEERKKWDIAVNIGSGKEAEYGEQYTLKADFLISGVGQLNQPYYPEIRGLENFSGKVMHSARWDWTYPINGKRVAIIGNGATAAQIIPEVAKQAISLTVFQRTPNWVVPRNDTAISVSRRTAYHYIPAIRKRYRSQLMDMREDFFQAASVPDTKEKDGIRKDCLEMMARSIPSNTELRAKLTPVYPPGCKRVICSDDFFPALNRSNVTLQTDPIEQITRTSISTSGKRSHEHEIDCLILATGFKTQQFLFPMEIYGSQGRSLSDVWKEAPSAFRGVNVESMPNFGILYGPNTNLGHNSIVLMIEAQSRYLNALIGKVIAAKKAGLLLALSPKPAVIESYNKWLQERLQKSTFADPRCQSWYKTAEGRILNNWCGTVVEYQQMMSKVQWQNYEIEDPGNFMVSRGAFDQIGRVVEESSFLQKSLDGVLIGSSVLFAGAFLWPRTRL
ncbi:cyclohexanone monooxygenase [Microthyrium microscopicum]|uniref:Cyclohexanone monooxygenase n=1 Tax=Microthyrium microscopicum TaxID=703497 RepID=A0A6A6UK27_9PEZI|nr:cyclohexanone monooxygenase [Microthyrium microscopicum]